MPVLVTLAFDFFRDAEVAIGLEMEVDPVAVGSQLRVGDGLVASALEVLGESQDHRAAVEQLLVGGAPESGLTWLGGPVAFSLAAHALIAIVVTFGLAYLTRETAKTLASLVRIAFACIALPAFRDAAAPLHERRDGAPFGYQRSPHSRPLSTARVGAHRAPGGRND